MKGLSVPIKWDAESEAKLENEANLTTGIDFSLISRNWTTISLKIAIKIQNLTKLAPPSYSLKFI